MGELHAGFGWVWGCIIGLGIIGKGLKRRESTLAGFEEKGLGNCLVKFLQLLSHKSKTEQKGVLY